MSNSRGWAHKLIAKLRRVIKRETKVGDKVRDQEVGKRLLLLQQSEAGSSEC